MPRIKQVPTARPASTSKSGPPKTAVKPKTELNPTQPAVKKARRYRPGTVALRLVRKEQKQSHRTHAFKRSHVRHIIKEAFKSIDKTHLRIGRGCVDVLREAGEDFGQQLYGIAQDLCSLESKQTPRPRHYRYAASLVNNGARRTAPNMAFNDDLRGPSEAAQASADASVP